VANKPKAPKKKKKLTGKMPALMRSKVDGMPIRTRPKKKDKNRKLSIDVGIKDHELDYMIENGMIHITIEGATYMADNDITKCTFELMNYLPYWHKIDEIRKEVLINMCFNLGMPRLKGFKNMFKELEKAVLETDNYEPVKEEMIDSAWHRQVKGRAKELEKQMLEGKRTTSIGG